MEPWTEDEFDAIAADFVDLVHRLGA